VRDRGQTRVPTDCGSQKHIFFGSLTACPMFLGPRLRLTFNQHFQIEISRWCVGMSTADFNHQSLVLQRTEFEVIGELEPEDYRSQEASTRSC